jgi:hypothetical protein
MLINRQMPVKIDINEAFCGDSDFLLLLWQAGVQEAEMFCDDDGQGHKKRGQSLTLTPNLHMNLPYCFIIRSVILSLLFTICIT